MLKKRSMNNRQTNNTDALVRLDRRLTRALAQRRGVRLSAADLELISSEGLIKQLSKAAAAALDELAFSRALLAASIGCEVADL